MSARPILYVGLKTESNEADRVKRIKMNTIKLAEPSQVTATKNSKFDYMGFAWYKIFVNGQPYMKQGVHLKCKAVDENHAVRMFIQTERN